MSIYNSRIEWAARTIPGIGILPGPLYSDYLVPGLSLRLGATPPILANFRDGLYQYAFAGTGSQTEEAHFVIHFLHDIAVGTTPTIHIHWAHNKNSETYTPNTAVIKWSVEVSLAKGYSAGVYPTSIVLLTTQIVGAQYTAHITDDDDIPLTSLLAELEPDAILLGRVFRNPADIEDTFGYPAFLLHLDLHYQKGQLGTLERNRPFISAGFNE